MRVINLEEKNAPGRDSASLRAMWRLSGDTGLIPTPQTFAPAASAGPEFIPAAISMSRATEGARPSRDAR